MNNEFKKTYSISEIATKLNRPPTTLTTWKNQFKEFIPSVGVGRNKRYTEEAIHIFALIERMKSANEPLEIIRKVLQENVNEIIIDESDDAPPPLMNELLDGYTNILEILQEYKYEMQAYRDEIQQLRTDNERLTKQLEQLGEGQRRIEENQQAFKEKQEEASTQIKEEISKRDKELLEWMREVQEVKRQIAATEDERKNKGFFARLFGK